MSEVPDLAAYPGGDLVAQGIKDLERGIESVPVYLVAMARTRLRSLGFQVPESPWGPTELRLYELLAAELGDGAHSRYNALRRRLSSFIRAVGCARP
ncbi:MAG: hypothetical protein L0Z55_01185 [Planctomycetes bacterium]|nr:hypothetical protein [Planctomycetota bacterium]